MNIKLNVIQDQEQDLIKSIEKIMSPKATETRWAIVDQERVLEIQK